MCEPRYYTIKLFHVIVFSTVVTKHQQNPHHIVPLKTSPNCHSG